MVDHLLLVLIQMNSHVILILNIQIIYQDALVIKEY